MRIDGSSKVFALLGDPVAQSLSPLMQNAAFHALGLDAVYVALRCDAAALPGLMETLAGQGGGGNVTIPHKAAAAAVIASQGGAAGPICNTFWGRAGRLEGAETDSEAILAVLGRLEVTRGDWLLLGTGGSARAALHAARRAGARIAVRSRSADRAASFAAVAQAEGVALADASACQVVLNCTPLGLRLDDTLPIAPERAPGARVALDLVYARGGTAWTRAMRDAGRVTADGREVLLEQGALAFEHWFPGQRAPREIMRAAVQSALA